MPCLLRGLWFPNANYQEKQMEVHALSQTMTPARSVIGSVKSSRSFGQKPQAKVWHGTLVDTQSLVHDLIMLVMVFLVIYFLQNFTTPLDFESFIITGHVRNTVPSHLGKTQTGNLRALKGDKTKYLDKQRETIG